VYYDPSHPDVAVLVPGLVEELKLLFKLNFIPDSDVRRIFFCYRCSITDAPDMPKVCTNG